jgi:tripartite-type tricarboxylate transporter receptor subunit TctC
MSEERSVVFPDVPTMKEQGLPNLIVQTWYGLFAPAGTPAAIVTKLNADMNSLLDQAEIRQVLARQDMNAVGGTPERFAGLVRTDLARWARVVSAANIKAN